jgi:hypothetical protein
MLGVYPAASLRIFDASLNSGKIADAVVITAIRDAAEHCPGIINLSFGSVAQDPFLQDAILTAVRNGCLVVAAAGNDGDTGSPAAYPAAWPHVFTVGATDRSDAVAPFSTTGQDVDIVAPGVGITGAVPLSRDISGYTTASGTSFAAPMVSAAAAWVWTMRPTLTVSQVADVLRASARDIGPPGFDNASGSGIVDIPGALAKEAPATDPSEPNDDIEQVKPGRLFQAGEAPLTSPARPTIRVAGSIDASEDPRDVYRIWVPAKKTVRVSVSAAGRAAARIWGPQTVAVNEGVAARRRDLRGTSVRAPKKGFEAYVEVLLTGRSSTAAYTLAVTASKR